MKFRTGDAVSVEETVLRRDLWGEIKTTVYKSRIFALENGYNLYSIRKESDYNYDNQTFDRQSSHSG